MRRYIIWIEGLEYKDGEKIKTINENGAFYTRKITKAMRIKESDIPAMKEWMRCHNFANWVIEGNYTFIKTTYTPKNTLFTFKT